MNVEIINKPCYVNTSVVQTTPVFSETGRGLKMGCTTISAQGSTRSSKTYNILIFLILYCLKNENIRLSVVRSTLPSLRGSVFIDFEEILYKLDVYDEKCLNKTQMTYTFPNRSRIEFFSTDSEQKLRGRKRDVLFVNEANELSFIEWKQLKMRTTRFAIIDYNPSFTDDHWISTLNKDSRTYHFITTYKDNPFLEQTIIDEIESLQHQNKSLWQVYGLGIQAKIEGLIFDSIEIVEQIPENIDWRRGAIDFGYSNDPTAIVEVAKYDNDLYIDEKCYRTKMLTNEIVSELKQHLNGYRIISESADPRLVDEIYNAGVNIIPVEKYAGSVDAGINKLKEFKIKITKRSVNVIKEFKNYTYSQDKEGKWLNKPIDAYNHSIDSIRYVIIAEILGRNFKVNTNEIFNSFR